MRPDAKKTASERVGTRIGEKWLLDRLLGIGGCASVYAATHRNGAKAAVKILHAHAFEDETIRTRFIREGYVANKVGHPGVVSVLDDDVTPEGLPYLVMELLDGRSLDLHRKDGPMPIEEALRIGDQVLEVLERAHAEGIVHRDLKPANLFLTATNQVKVLDFGIARLVQATATEEGASSATATGLVLGTAAVMPPEHARARWNEVDGRADLWALAATMLALMLGRRPRIAATPSEDFLLAMTEPMTPARTLLPELTPSVATVLDRALAFKREDRWPDAATMREALQTAVKDPNATFESKRLKGTLVMANLPLPPPPSSSRKEVTPKRLKATLPMTADSSKMIAVAVAAADASNAPAQPSSPAKKSETPAPPQVKAEAGSLKMLVSVLLFVALALGGYALLRLVHR